MKYLLLLCAASVATLSFAQTPASFIGKEHHAATETANTYYGSYITAAEEGGFFISPHAGWTGSGPSTVSDTIYFHFPSDPQYTASADFSPHLVKIAPPTNEVLSFRYGSLILEMGDYLLIGDSLGDYQSNTPPRFFLYEEIHDQNGVRWEYTGKKHELNGNFWTRDIEKISSTEIVIGGYDSVFVYDFNPNASAFLSRKQYLQNPLTPSSQGVVRTYGSSIEATGNFLFIAAPNDGTFTGTSWNGSVFVYERASSSDPYVQTDRISGFSHSTLSFGWRMEVTEVNGDVLLAINRLRIQGDPSRLHLYKLDGSMLTLQDSLDMISRGSFDLDANRGVFYLVEPFDRTYKSSNTSVGSVRILEPQMGSNGKYELNWTGAILPPTGAASDTTRMLGSVAIGNPLATNQPSNQWNYAWAAGMIMRQGSNNGQTVDFAGGWITPWDAQSNTISLSEARQIELNVFPIPATNNINVTCQKIDSPTNVLLTDMNGHVVRTLIVSSPTFQINKGELAAGIYVLQIQIGQHIVNQKVIFE
ncbi:T9SS type A sorting domain-containing protein [Phaeocystidibacter luteus]|uniref:T9SS type A sorting domain-containing protein n=1 Tax=Phaeocystidibacter luteus TaxID=911197 RepID=A0A6N6RK30_9FLAO|nr:T9SS type A sorting domain-containing protein [Phaeocystidibacter luteus]KAB2808661.1 T9SS type A sorting domain-containing protein [Phaeocystidibacter luteus]